MSNHPDDASHVVATFQLLCDRWPPTTAGDDPCSHHGALGDPLTRILRRIGVLSLNDRILDVSRAGDGNMNLTLRVRTTQGSLIVKQARPWVEKYPQIPAPVERTGVEHAFYRRVAGIPEVAGRMPRVLGFAPDAHVLALEDLGRLSDLTAAYRGLELPDSMLRELALYVVSLHHETRGGSKAGVANAAMKRLNHEHLFVVPLDPHNGLDLDRYEPGLSAAAATFRDDPGIVQRIDSLGRRYLRTGECLVHGDFFPGSWIEARDGIRVIDPEFCFYGDAEFDLGVAMAHLLIADATGAHACGWRHACLDACAAIGAPTPNESLLVEYACVEIIRRIIGVAQLLIPPSTGSRAQLLCVARRALLNPSPEVLLA